MKYLLTLVAGALIVNTGLTVRLLTKPTVQAQFVPPTIEAPPLPKPMPTPITPKPKPTQAPLRERLRRRPAPPKQLVATSVLDDMLTTVPQFKPVDYTRYIVTPSDKLRVQDTVLPPTTQELREALNNDRD